jgi:hypothetical protein
MTALVNAYALPLALAAALGLVVGWARTGTAGRVGPLSGLIAWAALAGALAAAGFLLGGRPGLWAETGLLLLGAYLAACALASGLRRLSSG